MDQVLEHDPGHVRTRAHYEAMVRELQQEVKIVAPAQARAAAFQAQQERIAAALRRGTRITEKRMPL